MKPDMDSTAAVLYCIAVVLCLILRTYFFGSTFLCVHIGGDNNDIMLHVADRFAMILGAYFTASCTTLTCNERSPGTD